MSLLGNSVWTITNMPKYITITKIQRKTNLTWCTRFPHFSPHISCWMVICDDDDVDDVDEGERWYLIIISEILTYCI